MNVKRYFLIPLVLIFLPSISCVSENIDMKRLVEVNISEYIRSMIEKNQYRFEGNIFYLDKELLEGWLVEEVKIESLDVYEKMYKGKKEKLLNIDITKRDYDSQAEISAFDMVWLCIDWLYYTSKIYDIPRLKNLLYPSEDVLFSFFDIYCYRLMKIDTKNIRVYDITFILHKKAKFIDDDTNLNALLNKELETLRPSDGHIRGIFRDLADVVSVEVAVEQATQIKKFYLLQLVAKRYAPRSYFLHAGFGKKRIRDTYIIILNGEKIKIIIQTFYSHKASIEEIERDLKTILGAISIK